MAIFHQEYTRAGRDYFIDINTQDVIAAEKNVFVVGDLDVSFCKITTKDGAEVIVWGQAALDAWDAIVGV